ncbi:NAD(P)H-hydrate dehydratase [Candidatus Curtissbacteria bacterium RBG_13_35_7]|uniref:ADP-dependent (S)-NAD(P)H-hydrate dehydratase n=1 Tax=Candidatus Curtissbacteria bacterium RBG_13_35_7 TaxID=1797705 RepID=A0A1F5G435_9BACT|nr:MAG: NAD(P)H-hydrate dehydratase [Candidatus Curtissbacteria bacterium RBG_13_35_7]
MDLSKIYSPRPDWAHKGNYGSVLVIGGSKFYSGSATLAAVAAVRSGADLVTVAASQRAADVASHTLCDLITYPLKGDYLSGRHVSEVLEVAHLRRINSVVIGCGLGRHKSTLAAVRRLISKFTVPIVADADALLAIGQKPKVISGKHLILTPHAGELTILLKGVKTSIEFEQRLVQAKKAAKMYQSIILLKGHIDIITDGDIAATNNSGTSQMTKGGFGDTLAGICGALLARGVGLFEAAHVAAYINGIAGQMAADNMGEGVAASNIFEFIPKVINAGNQDIG